MSLDLSPYRRYCTRLIKGVDNIIKTHKSQPSGLTDKKSGRREIIEL